MLHSFSRWIIPLFILCVLLIGEIKGVKVYDAFIRGAKEGLTIGVRLIPFFLAIFGALAVFRSSGALDFICRLCSPLANALGIPGEIFPLGLLKPLSGSGSLGYMAEIINHRGPDSPLGLMASVVGGSTETTFYVITVYLGSVGISKQKHTVAMGIAADLVSFLVAVFCSRWLFPS
ncbi:MAG TPA: spore maturation protein [Firmicutes bacterium]|nr:spore maturation protein [Bacillota bacterium]